MHLRSVVGQSRFLLGQALKKDLEKQQEKASSVPSNKKRGKDRKCLLKYHSVMHHMGGFCGPPVSSRLPHLFPRAPSPRLPSVPWQPWWPLALEFPLPRIIPLHSLMASGKLPFPERSRGTGRAHHTFQPDQIHEGIKQGFS